MTESLSLAQVGSSFELTGDEAHHLARVRRAPVGAAIEALDGKGYSAILTITDIHKQGRDGWIIYCAVTRIQQHPRPRPRLEIWAAPPKGDRLPQMVEQLSQAGACAFVPLETVRGVAEAGDNKLDRLRRITRESIKQCGRPWEMEVTASASLQSALTHDAITYVADSSGTKPQIPANASTVRVLVGPEGGFTSEELAMLDASGTQRVGLGPHIMRTETAAVAAAILFRLA